MLQLETTTSEAEKAFSVSSLLQSWNLLQRLQTSGKLQSKIINYGAIITSDIF